MNHGANEHYFAAHRVIDEIIAKQFEITNKIVEIADTFPDQLAELKIQIKINEQLLTAASIRESNLEKQTTYHFYAMVAHSIITLLIILNSYRKKPNNAVSFVQVRNDKGQFTKL